MTKFLLALLACGLLIGVTGCGGGGDDAAPEAAQALEIGTSIHDIESWVAELDHDEGHVDIGEFADHPRLPTPPVNLAAVRRFSLAAALAGDEVVFKVQKITRFTNLSEEEKTGLACFLVEKTVAGEISPDQASIEKLIESYAYGRFFSSMPATTYGYEAYELGEALEEADSNSQRFADLAVAGTCTYVEHR